MIRRASKWWRRWFRQRGRFGIVDDNAGFSPLVLSLSPLTDLMERRSGRAVEEISRELGSCGATEDRVGSPDLLERKMTVATSLIPRLVDTLRATWEEIGANEQVSTVSDGQCDCGFREAPHARTIGGLRSSDCRYGARQQRVYRFIGLHLHSSFPPDLEREGEGRELRLQRVIHSPRRHRR
jgi:hypothetical protein